MTETARPSPPEGSLLVRFRTWLAWAIALAAVLYVAGSTWAGFDKVSAALVRYSWPTYLLVLALTLVNYGLRFWKWHYLTRRLGVRLPANESAIIFASGLAMVISPGKAGELLKPYLVRERTGIPMTRTIPALITERLTDGIAALVLAAISVSTYAGEHAAWVYGTIGVVAVGLGILSHGPTSLAILHLLRRLPGLSRLGARLEELYEAMRVCVAPGPLLLTLGASMVAWGAECVGYKVVFAGFGHDASLDLSTFLYAFATAAGGLMPGGLGVADSILVGLPPRFVPGLDEGTAVASALLIRVATLWFGVLIGAVALVLATRLLDHPLDAPPKI